MHLKKSAIKCVELHGNGFESVRDNSWRHSSGITALGDTEQSLVQPLTRGAGPHLHIRNRLIVSMDLYHFKKVSDELKIRYCGSICGP